MDFTLTEDQQAFRDTARAFATERMLPHAARWDAEKVFPVETLREAADKALYQAKHAGRNRVVACEK